MYSAYELKELGLLNEQQFEMILDIQREKAIRRLWNELIERTQFEEEEVN